MADSFNELFGLGVHSEDANLEGWWPCQDDAANTTVDDRSSNGRDITLSVNTSTVAAAGPNSWLTSSFDLTNSQNGETTDATIIALPQTHAMTVLCRVNPDTNGDDNSGIYHAAWAFRGADDLVFYPNDDSVGSGGVRLFWRNVGTTIISESGSDLTGSWLNYAFITRASDDHEVRRNGASVGTSSATGSAGPFSGFVLGDFKDSPQLLDGRACDYAVFGRDLSNDEIDEWEAGPEANYSSGVSWDEDGNFNVGTWALPSPFAAGSNGTVTYEVVAANAAGSTIDSTTGSSGTLDISAEAGNTVYLLVRASNTGGYDVGDKATRTSGFGSAGDGYYEIASVTAAGGGGGSEGAAWRHYAQMMGVG